MSFYPPLSANPDFNQQELDILNWWYSHDLVSQYLTKNQSSTKTFSFIDGPITANGPMGAHHARGRTLKDVFQRYKNALGFAQRFQNGFDCQGLWVEVEVEKEAGFNSKKDIIDYGVDKFTQACVDRVNKFASLQTEQSKRLGMFMDWDNSYYTNSPTNNLYIWHFLKTVWQKGWLVQKQSATTWCPRCETGLSQHEQADGYQIDTDTSVYLKFRLSDAENEYVLAWTTTPWTLSANVLLAINTDFAYVRARHEGQIIYLAQLAADRLGLTDYDPIDAKSLLNRPYHSLYDIPAQAGVKHYITNWDLVDPVEGTGVVHIAPGCGQEDFELGKTLNADIIAPLDERGYFTSGFGPLTGQYAHDVAPQVFDYLSQIGALFKTEAVTHRYPHCWRCKTKCLFRLENNWYMSSELIRPLLKEAAAKVNWRPQYAGRRMQNWLDTMEDWMISRKRFYGLALPFYPCAKCHQLTVVGSLEELKGLAVEPSLVDSLKSLHRPYIDQVKIKCPHCQETVSRIPDVGDVWLDAGIVPFSTLKYLEDKNYWQKWFPADLVLEMIEQVRLWFYSMLFMSVTLEGVTPYQNVVTHGEVRDEAGERMSKTKKNGIPYDQAVSQMTADAMRWLYCQQKSHISVNFGYNIATQVKRDFLLILWNSFKFFIEHANIDNWQPTGTKLKLDTNTPLIDRWLISRYHHTIKSVSLALDKFQTPPATTALEKFVSDLSTWYIRRSRERSDHYLVLSTVFEGLSRLLAPFTPFMSELIFQTLSGRTLPESDITVHSQDWPQFDQSLIDVNLEKQMEIAREIAKAAHAGRQSAAIKVRQPLGSASVTSPQKLDLQFIDLIKDETNIKNLEFNLDPSSPITVSLNTDLTPELIAEGESRDLIRQIQVMRKSAGLSVRDQIIITAPSWPKSYEPEILKKTLAQKIQTGPELKVEKV